MSNTVFDKIISGQLEGSFVYRDDICVAFMDLHPQNEGHLLVVPIKSVAHLADLEPTTAAHLFLVAQKILKAIQSSSLQCEGANILISDGEIAGQEVPHVHLHVIPRFANDGLRLSFGKAFRKQSRTELNRIAAILSPLVK